MSLVRTPKILQALLPGLQWRNETREREIYLTFDDGPIPTVTPWVLSILADFKAKATFFCVGHNIEKHPDIYQQILMEGHQTGSHTFNHLDGWHTTDEDYFANIRKGAELVGNRLFRPPYGRIKPLQFYQLRRQYQIVMWDILSRDFDQSVSPDACLDNILRNVCPGSIIVLHDSIKTFDKLTILLPRLLDLLSRQGYQFSAIPLREAPDQVLQPAIAV